jgi:predicted ArsR family transcriptional regulator
MVAMTDDRKQQLLDLLKRRAPVSVAELADDLGVTHEAVRQHLVALERRGLVVSRSRPAGGRGRPAYEFLLSDLARDLFPDRHADLTVELIGTVRRALGDEALRKVVDVRARTQLRSYRLRLPGPDAPLEERAEALAEQRTREGYMAEVRRDDDGSLLLIEHHCPVCEAAKACTGICSTELDVFRKVLSDARVEREQHLLEGDARCVYRIRTRTGDRHGAGRR